MNSQDFWKVRSQEQDYKLLEFRFHFARVLLVDNSITYPKSKIK